VAVAHPQTNGRVEQANDMILQGLKPRIFDKLNKSGRKWLQELPAGRVEPQNHPEQGHMIHLVLPGLWHGGCPHHGLGVRVSQSKGL
jgi:hypothetical protein